MWRPHVLASHAASDSACDHPNRRISQYVDRDFIGSAYAFQQPFSGRGADACKSKEDAQEVSVPDDYELDEDLVDEDAEELPRIRSTARMRSRRTCQDHASRLAGASNRSHPI